MSRQYTEQTKYLLAAQISTLLYYWTQHAYINTIWNTGSRFNEALALGQCDSHLNTLTPHVVIHTANQRRSAGGHKSPN